MRGPSLFLSAFALLSCASATTLETRNMAKRADVNATIEQFVASLPLSSDDQKTAIAVIEPYADEISANTTKRSNASVPMAQVGCQLAQMVYGEQYSDASVRTSNYTTLNEIPWSTSCWLSPQCIISPTSAQEVSYAMSIISFLGVKFSIRSGGHTPNPGHNDADSDGILIDMSKFTDLTVSEDKSTVSLGPGLRWGDVYAQLEPYGINVMGGRIPHVGVGGLILGGGLSFFSAEYGLACDTAKNYEVVLASGQIVNANATENSDLFWALKGGSANFGIVTRYDMEALPIDQIWYQALLYDPSQNEAIVRATAEYQLLAEKDPKAGYVISIGATTTLLVLVYSAPVENPAVFAPFQNITNSGVFYNSTIGPLGPMVSGFSAVFPTTPARHDYRSQSCEIDADLYVELLDEWKTLSDDLASINGTISYVLQPISQSLIDYGNSKGGNTLGITGGPQTWFTTVIDWTNASDDEYARGIGIKLTDSLKTLAEKKGKSLGFHYLNDSSRDQDPVGTYSAENIAKMKTISKKYDPLQVFQCLQTDGFLLEKA